MEMGKKGTGCSLRTGRSHLSLCSCHDLQIQFGILPPSKMLAITRVENAADDGDSLRFYQQQAELWETGQKKVSRELRP